MQRFDDDKNDRLNRLLEEREKSMNKRNDAFIQPNKSVNPEPVILATKNEFLDNNNINVEIEQIDEPLFGDSKSQKGKDNTALYIVGGVIAIAGLFILYNSVKKDKNASLNTGI